MMLYICPPKDIHLFTIDIDRDVIDFDICGMHGFFD